MMISRNHLQNLMHRLNDTNNETQSSEAIEHSIATAVLAAQGFASALTAITDELENAGKDYLFSGFGDPGQKELRYIKDIAREFMLLVGTN